ncbi:stalk domain-containing protein [Cohnella faecalis]|uniref:stalk domain-containing protein n=1 Tax=Cohnella faecalis TaxID=2315694 RepID=UPI0013146B2F|nr:stalk domain-containing protein [Cohnella faecalis]
MKRLKTKQGFVTAMLVAALSVSVPMNVFGAGALTEIKVFLNTGIKVIVEGKSFNPALEDGTKLVPITYKGSTYLPLRAVAEATGLKVSWDPNTSTAYLGKVEGDIAKEETSYIRASSEFVYNGEATYRLSSRTPEQLTTDDGTVFGFGYVTGGSRSVTIEVETKFAYSKFKAKIWSADSLTKDDLKIEIRDENNISVKELKVKNGGITELELDIKDTNALRIYVQGDKSIIGEPMLRK